jgi:hypothetical protein
VSAVSAQQVLVVVLAGALLTAVIRLTRRGALDVGLASLWLTIAAIGATSALLIPLVEPVGGLLGLTPAALLTAATSIVLLAITLVLSHRMVDLADGQQDLAEAVALLAAHPVTDDAPGRTLVVVPAWNESASIGAVVADLCATGLPVLVVDDGSTDDTGALAAAAGAQVIRLPRRQGVGAALRAGFRLAVAQGFTQVIQADGDGQHPPENVTVLLAGPADADLIIGSRFTRTGSRRSEGLVRRTAMGLLARTASSAAGHRITDASSGSRLVRQPLLGSWAQRFPRHYLGDTFEATVAAARAGYRIAEVPVPNVARAHGSSSASVRAATRFTLRALVAVLTRTQAELPPRPVDPT